MKVVEATIDPFKLEDVRACLELLGVGGATINEVASFGSDLGPPSGGTRWPAGCIPQVQLSAVVPDAFAAEVLEAIAAAARTGRAGDGRIVIVPVEEVVRVRTGERGPAAI
jgi:nitrogen regulatory protein P-II 1